MRKSFTFVWMLFLALVAGSLTRVHTQEPPPPRALPPLSAPMRQYFQEHPEEFQRFLESLPVVSQQREIVQGDTPAPGAAPVAGTWSSLTHPLAGHNLSNPVLLTDGTVIAHESCTSNWWRFTPSNTGSYVDGTWSVIASTAAGYAPRFFGSGVLPDGRVVIEGGEYNGAGCGARTTQGAIYDPVANIWTAIAPPAGWGVISDAAGIVLPNGTYMQTSCCDFPPHTALLNPATLGWTATGAGKFDVYDEESMALLHDGTVLIADAYVFTGTCGTNSERYTPATGTWTSAGSTIVQQSDCNGMGSFEVGPLVMRPDGTAVSFSGRTSGVPQTAIFNTATNTWSAGPNHPSIGGVPYTMADAPAAMLPNGNILVAMSPSNWPASNTFPSPTHFWELNADNTWTQVPDKADAASWNSYEANFILLPTGQVMAFTVDGPTVQVYTPGGTFANAWRPTISSVPAALSPSQVFTLSGTQLNGLNEGTYYGDDTNASTNFPIVRIRNNATGHIFYARTFNHSSRSIAPGAASSTSVAMPASIETGASTLEVVANGIPSLPASITVAVPAPAVMTTPAPGSTIGGTVSFGWTAGVGASQYWLYVGTTAAGSFNIYSSSTGTTQSATVSGVPTTGTIYVRLWTLLSSGWTFNDYTYVGGVPVAAAITTPTPGTRLAGTAATFNWNAGVGITQYWLFVGTTGVGSADIYNASAGTALSAAVTGLPTVGTIYVRLWSLAFDGWRFRDYTYTGSVAQAAVLTTPRPGSTLGGSSQTFRWNSGSGSSQSWLYVGTTGVGSANIFNASAGTALSQLVTGNPTSGAVYVRLWSLLPSGWAFNDYTYTGGQAAELTIPPPSTILSGSTTTFGWNPVTGASQYWLYVGTTGVGSANIFNSSTGSAVTATAAGIPTSGTVYVRLWTLASFWQFNDYTYTGGTVAAMTTPLPGSALSSSTTTFGWSTGTGVDQYYLYVGTTGTGSLDTYAASTGTTPSATVSNLPTSGTIYVRLWSHLISGWVFNDYTYTGLGAAAIRWPVPGATLSGSSVTFDWDAGNAASQYWLYVGTTGVGSADIYSASAGTAQAVIVNTVPTSGTVFVRLWSLLPTGWAFNDYTYTGAP